MRGAVLIALLAAWVAPNAVGQENFVRIDKPADGEFVADLAEMLELADEAAIRTQGESLLKETATPILVVTIPSMREHGGAGLRIETFARLLFDQWGIGHEEINGSPSNTGILLLVSRDDRRARIELGAGWKREKDALCKRIMDDLIVPRFKEGEFAAGIRAGVEALDAMARGKKLPRRPRTKREIFWMFLLGGLAFFTGVSLLRRGRKGWSWLFWGVVLGILGTVIYSALRSGGSSGGGFSGGSFGGGFSGGGGATGSW